MEILEETIGNNKPSVPINELVKYKFIKDKMEGNNKDKVNRIGFK